MWQSKRRFIFHCSEEYHRSYSTSTKFERNMSAVVVMMIPTAQKHSLRAAIQGLHGEVLQEIAIDQAGCPPVVAGELTNIAGDPVSGETAEYLIRPGLEDFAGQQAVAANVNPQLRSRMLGRQQERTQVVAIIATTQKHSLHMALQLLHGEVFQEVGIDQTGVPTNIAVEPVGGETAERLVRRDLEDFMGQQTVTYDGNLQSRSCMLRRPQEHSCTCDHCQIRDDIQATFAWLGDQPLPEGSLC